GAEPDKRLALEETRQQWSLGKGHQAGKQDGEHERSCEAGGRVVADKHDQAEARDQRANLETELKDGRLDLRERTDKSDNENAEKEAQETTEHTEIILKAERLLLQNEDDNEPVPDNHDSRGRIENRPRIQALRKQQ